MHLNLKKRLALEFYRHYRHNEVATHPLTYFFLGVHLALQPALPALR